MNAIDPSNCPSESYMPRCESTRHTMYMPPKGIQMPMEEDEDDYDDYEKDEKDEKDREYMISMYPDLCKCIQRLSEEECDKLEYEGSLMYDEYPDRKEIDKIVTRIYVIVEKEQVMPNLTQEVGTEEKEVEAQQVIVPGVNPWLWNNVQVGFLNELFGRRRRYPRSRYPNQYPYRQYPRYRRRPYPIYQPYQPYQPYQSYVPYYYRGY